MNNDQNTPVAVVPLSGTFYLEVQDVPADKGTRVKHWLIYYLIPPENWPTGVPWHIVHGETNRIKILISKIQFDWLTYLQTKKADYEKKYQISVIRAIR